MDGSFGAVSEHRVYGSWRGAANRMIRELIVAAKSSSGLAPCGLPEFELLRGAEFFAGPLAAVAGESI